VLWLFDLRSFFSGVIVTLGADSLKTEEVWKGWKRESKIWDPQKLQSCEIAHFTRRESMCEVWRKSVWRSSRAQCAS
jgi:hypothetical protein